MYLTLTNFTQRKRKTFDGNDLLTLSVINIIVYIYSLRKKFYCTYLKITEHDMILSYGKPFNDKMQEELAKKFKKKKKKQVSNFSKIYVDDNKTKKKHKSVLLV